VFSNVKERQTLTFKPAITIITSSSKRNGFYMSSHASSGHITVPKLSNQLLISCAKALHQEGKRSRHS
jgi:hypothetical protein